MNLKYNIVPQYDNWSEVRDDRDDEAAAKTRASHDWLPPTVVLDRKL